MYNLWVVSVCLSSPKHLDNAPIATHGLYMAKSVGKKIREERLALGWSIRRLARESGIPASTVQGIEAGVITDPRASIVVALADALDVAIQSVLRETK